MAMYQLCVSIGNLATLIILKGESIGPRLTRLVQRRLLSSLAAGTDTLVLNTLVRMLAPRQSADVLSLFSSLISSL